MFVDLRIHEPVEVRTKHSLRLSGLYEPLEETKQETREVTCSPLQEREEEKGNQSTPTNLMIPEDLPPKKALKLQQRAEEEIRRRKAELKTEKRLKKLQEREMFEKVKIKASQKLQQEALVEALAKGDDSMVKEIERLYMYCM